MEIQAQIPLRHPLSAVWAIDPGEESSRPDPECLSVVKYLLGGSYVNVHPAYVCDRDGSLLKEHQLLENYLSDLRVGPIADADLIYSPTHLRHDWAERIVRRAEHHHAKLIVLISRGHSAVTNFFTGSFAHELLLLSPFPLLLPVPHAPADLQKQKVMFTTDFSEASKEAFKNFLQLIKGKAHEVILFYVEDNSVFTVSAAQIAGLPVYVPDSVLDEQKEWAERELQRWGAEAARNEIDVQLQTLVSDSKTSVIEAIEKKAESEKVSLIGLATHSGPLSRLVFGSVSRGLISKRRFNLCVYGPRFHESV